MKGLALGVAIVLIAGVVAMADDPAGVGSYRGGGQDFRIELRHLYPKMPNRMGVRFIEPKTQHPQIEQRLDEIEKKLDRILEELEGMKGQPQAATPEPFTYYIGAFY